MLKNPSKSKYIQADFGRALLNIPPPIHVIENIIYKCYICGFWEGAIEYPSPNPSVRIHHTQMLCLRIWGGMGGGNHLGYHIQHPIEICHHFVIPKPQHRISFFPEVFGPRIIITRLKRMLPPVQFDHHFISWRTEIHNVWPDGVLAAKSYAEKMVGSQVSP